jgi:cell wall-associated NlpC family hydrolase
MGKHRPSPTGRPAAELLRLYRPEPPTVVLPAIPADSPVTDTGRIPRVLIAGAIAASVVTGVSGSGDPATSPASAPGPTSAEMTIPDRHAISAAQAAARLRQIEAARATRDAERAAAAEAARAAEVAAQEAQEAAKRAAEAQAAEEASAAATVDVVTADTPTETAPAGAPGSAAQSAVDFALAQQGEAYVWGATGPDTWDCSGLVLQAYAAAGISLPRVSADQAQAGVAVSRDQLQPGDLVAFYSPVSHIGIYIGNGQIVHAPTSGDVVKITDIDAFGSITAMRRVA